MRPLHLLAGKGSVALLMGKTLSCICSGAEVVLLTLPCTEKRCSRKGGSEGDIGSHPSFPCSPMSLGCSQCPALCYRADSGPTESLAVVKDLREAPRAGGAVQCLVLEGCHGLLHQYMILAEEIISCALASSARPSRVHEGRERILAHL